MNINRLNNLALVVSLLALGACADQGAEVTECKQDIHAVVSFSIDQGTKSLTRAEKDGIPFEDGTSTTYAENREKNINNHNIGVAVFQDNKFFKYFGSNVMTKTAATGADPDLYSFDLGSLGAYEMYVLTNPSTTLEATLANTTNYIQGTTPLTTYFAEKETQAPGLTDAATDFFMTSRKQELNIDVSGTRIDDIEVTRAAIRIDIDASKMTAQMGSQFTITGVEYHNRYTSTMINNTDQTMTGLTVSATNPVVYTKDDTGMSSGISNGTDIWEGVIYGYENFNEADDDDDYDNSAAAIADGVTVLTLKGEYANGIVVSHDVIFPKEIKPTRNHIYRISMEPLDVEDEYGKVSHSITVKDWDTGETIAFSVQNMLTNAVKPDYEITTSPLPIEVSLTGGTINFTTLTVTDATAAVSFDIEVTCKGTAAKLFCLDDDLTDNEVPQGITIVESGTKTYNENGELVQTFTITVDALAAAGIKTYTIVVEDLLNDTKKSTFTLTNTKTS